MPIANFFIHRLLVVFRGLNHYDEDDIDVIRYGLEAFLWEIEKFVYMAVIFAVTGFWWQFLACAVAITSVRPMAGGFHASSAWRCFWITLFGFGAAIVVLPMFALNSALILLLGTFSLAVTIIAAPLHSKQMEGVVNRDRDKFRKYIAVAVTAVWFVILFVYRSHFLAPTVIWIIALQNLQLIITWIARRRNL